MALEDLPPTPITLPSGVTLNYARAGRGDALFLIHGAMGDYRSWGPQWSEFTKNFDCISYSRRYSFPNPDIPVPRDHNALVDAQDLLGLIQALGLDKVFLVGSSYGGFTALAAALAAPQRIRAVVAVEPPMMRYALLTETGRAVAEDFLATSARPAQEAFERGDDHMGIRILTAGIVGRDVEDVPEDIIARRMLNIRAARSLALSEDEFPWLEPAALAALPMPILLLSGADTAPFHAEIFKNVTAALPQARSMIVDGSGHSVSQQQPGVFNYQVLQFLADYGKTSADGQSQALT